MRISSGKSRAPLPFDTSSDTTASSSSKGHHPTFTNDSTFTTYGISELTPVSSSTITSDLDVTTLTDDEVRERFKSVMVRISFLSLMMLNLFIFLRMIYSKEMKQKRKCSSKQQQHI